MDLTLTTEDLRNLPGPAAPSATGSGLRLHRLRTPEQVATVLHLRDEIDLSAHAAAGSTFAELEKKETRWASSWASNSRAS